jgi:hypothetical protein
MGIENKAITIPRSSGNPAWLRGVSGNPGGRPRGLAALVRERTEDGAELVEFMLAVLRGKKRVNGNAPALSLRMEAAAWLADRGFGKVPQALEHTGQDGAPLRFTLVLSAAGTGFDDDDHPTSLALAGAPGDGDA